jgi:uracil-DNA glycosylase
MNALALLEQDIIACERCPRLRKHCRRIAEIKRRAYLDWDYWAKPIPSFGDPNARLLIVGLAPGAHGANRTGRIFTGDGSGDFLFRALYETGFASQPQSTHPDDGLRLKDCWITAAVRCAPPDNKPTPAEFRTCSVFLDRELALLANVKVVVCLGKLAFDAYLGAIRRQGRIGNRSRFPFGHGTVHPAIIPALITSYHPSRQNTSTGRLTAEMLRRIFEQANQLM